MVLFEPKSSVLLTWEIMGMHNPDESFQSLFERPKISAKLSQEYDCRKMLCWAYKDLAWRH